MRIQVVGAGGFGLALTWLLAHNEHNVRLWTRSPENAESLRLTRERPEYLPGIQLPASVEVSTEIEPDADMAVLAVPSHAMRETLTALPFSNRTIRLSVAKGIENDTLLRMTEVIAQVAGDCPIAALSGPSHAEEVGRGLPASVVVASACKDVSETVQQAFITPAFRVYSSQDVTGVELGGALKNVIAIAAGSCDGLGLGDNAKAALITRGLAEISRLGIALGADPLTFAGLSGMGDLIVTCASRHSRNRAVGERIAQGMHLDNILKSTRMVAEGIRTTRSARDLARRIAVEAPITEQVFRVLFENADVHTSVTALMTRDPKPERH